MLGWCAMLWLSLVTSGWAQSAALDPVPGTTAALVRLASGVVPEELEGLEAALAGDAPANVGLQLGRRSAQRAITELGFQLRGTGPALVATAGDPGMQLLVSMAARDTAGVRRAVAAVDAGRRRLSVRNLPPPLQLAEALVWLGDTTAALAHLMEFEAAAAEMNPSVSWGMVRNDWLVASTRKLLARLQSPRRAPADTAHYDLRPRAVFNAARFRYDAMMWAHLPTQGVDTERVVAKFTVHATERGTMSADGGLMVRQTYDGIDLDLPLRALLGLDDLTLRRQVRDASRDLTAETVTDAAGRVVRRTVRSAAPMPDELRGALEDGTGFLPLTAAVTWPARGVMVGETWRDSVRLWAPGGLFAPDTKVLATYRLERVVESGPRRLAFIAIAARSVGAESVVLSGELVLDVATGEALRLAASLRTSVARVLLTVLREPGATPTTVALAADRGAAGPP
jgi:hypothetical protein